MFNRIFKKAFTALIVFTSIPSAYSFYATDESRCSTVDLRQEFPLKIRDQGDISWCYAHATADYMQFHNRLPVQISAADIAIHYNRRKWPIFLQWLRGGNYGETGFIRSALWDSSEVGYCPEEYFPSDTWTRRTLSGPEAGKVEKIPLKAALKEIVDMAEAAADGFYLTPSDLPFVYEFKGMTHEQFFDAVLENPTANVLAELRSAACEPHRMPYPKILTEIEMYLKGKSAFNDINHQLNQKNPVTVDFFYGFLDNIDSYERSFAELHTTLLMGRRFNSETKQCQYLIKNSYGTDCAEYDRRHQCEDGYVWVSENSLFGAMTSYVYISGSENAFSQTAEQTQDDPDFQ